MSDKQDTLDVVLSVHDAVQDAVDQLNDYLNLFEDDEKVHGLLTDMLSLLEEVRDVGSDIRFATRNK